MDMINENVADVTGQVKKRRRKRKVSELDPNAAKVKTPNQTAA
jgi:hypothetical protein